MVSINVEKEKAFHNKIFEEGERKPLNSLYELSAYIYKSFYQKIQKAATGKVTVLEYGCGMLSMIENLTSKDAEKHSFDISDFAIENNKKQFKNVKYTVADAHDLSIYSNNCFDLVYGSSILHHLDLPIALNEIHRVLKPNGKMIFLEPLGHNYFINRFRNNTPNYRTEDEHPLLQKDLALISNSFNLSETQYFCLFPLINYAIFKQKTPAFLQKTAQLTDKLIFKILPFLRKYAWIVIIVGTKK